MKWIISHQSALEFWRRAQAENALAEKRLRAMKFQAKPIDIVELQAENFYGLTTPLHVLVGACNARKVNRNLQCHVNTVELPHGSFIRMDSGMVVSSPELCFLQMAGELPFVDLVALGYELCGNYRLATGNDPAGQNTTGNDESAENRGFRDDLPLTSVSNLISYIAKAIGSKGRKNAMKALHFVADGSASPMETILAIMIILPYRLGGYGFPKPLLNYCIEEPSANKSNPKSTSKPKVYYCDLYWPEEKVDVEYDSDAYHTGSARIEQDAIRRNALTNMGITVITVSRRQVIAALKMRELAKVLSRLLRKRLRYPRTEFTYRQAKLLEQLLPKLPTTCNL